MASFRSTAPLKGEPPKFHLIIYQLINTYVTHYEHGQEMFIVTKYLYYLAVISEQTRRY